MTLFHRPTARVALAACLGVTLLLVACMPEGSQLPDSQLLARLERKSGLIAYVSTDGNVYTINQGGGRQTALTTDALLPGAATDEFSIFQVPVWSPDSTHVAFVNLAGNPEEGVASAGLIVASADGREIDQVYSSTEEYPVYLAWSPDGKRIAFISENEARSSLLFQAVPADAPGEAVYLDVGVPLYWDWSPYGDMVIHADDETSQAETAHISLLDPTEAEFEDRLDLNPALFKAPAWSPDGQRMLVAAETTGGDIALVVANRWGEVEQEIADLQGAVSFAWSPDGDSIAYIAANEASSSSIVGNLMVVDVAQPDEPIAMAEVPTIAFFWSPNNRELVYFTAVLRTDESGEPAQGTENEQILAAFILDVNSGETRELTTFQPTTMFLNSILFFDQYQRSSTIWSPDSQNIVIGALTAEGTPGIFVVPTNGSIAPRFIAPGLMGFWSWQ